MKKLVIALSLTGSVLAGPAALYARAAFGAPLPPTTPAPPGAPPTEVPTTSPTEVPPGPTTDPAPPTEPAPTPTTPPFIPNPSGPDTTGTDTTGATPPPPPPNQAAAPAPVAQCERGPFVVYFDVNKSDVSAESAKTLDQAAQAHSNCSSLAVTVTGYTDSSGSSSHNQALSQRRAQSVRYYLLQHGVPPGVVTAQGKGEDPSGASGTATGPDAQGRRVEVTFGPGTGM